MIKPLRLMLVVLALCQANALAADKYAVMVVTDRETALYQSGETVRFLVTITKNGKPLADGEASYVVDDYVVDGESDRGFPNGKIELAGLEAVPIEATSKAATFLRCRVTYRPPNAKAISATAGAGFNVNNIEPSLLVPGDFDAFWSEQKKKLATVEAKAVLTPVKQSDESLVCADVQVPCLGGGPVSGYFAKPKDAAKKSLPAILWVHGAGVRGSSLGNAMTGAKAGMLSMDINAHGIPNGKPGKFYQDLNAGELKNYRYAGRENRATSYFRGMYLRLVRAIDFLTAQPEWDGKVVAVIGHSQGGGQALVAGGIDSRVTIIATGVPAICDHSGRVADRINGWPKLVPAGEAGNPDAKILEASRYVDAVNFASRCRAEAIMSVGFIDAVCPPSSCYAAYNQLHGRKQIINEPLMGHAAPNHIRTAFMKAIQQHVKRSRGEPAKQIELSPEIQKRGLAILRAGLKSEEFWPSIHAAEALTLAGRGAEVTALLAPKLAGEKDDQKRCGISRELVRAGDWGKAQAMLDILAGDDPHGHVHAAESLFKVAEIGDGEAMRKAMESDNVKLKVMSAAALARCGSPAAYKVLRGLLADEEEETARLAAWVLARIGDRSDIQQLRINEARAKSPVAVCYQQHALATLGDKRGRAALLKNLESSDPAIRVYSATFAGDARMLEAKDSLIALLDDDVLDVRIRAAQSLFVLSQVATDLTEDLTKLVYPATPENPRYTEGSIARLANGNLMYAVTQFIGDGSDFAKARIVASQSADGGRSWSKPVVVQKSTGKLNVMSVTLRRIRVDDKTPLAMFYLQKDGYNDLHAYMRLSADEGKTFGERVKATGEPGYHVMNNDRVVQLSSGRLLAPVASTPDVHKVNHFISYCWLSDDGGKTWRKGKGSVDLAKRGAMEPEVIELNDGRVMMIMRNQLGFISKSYSSNGGDRWSEPTRLSSLIAPEAPATLRRIPSTGDLLLVWNNNYTAGKGHGGKRTPLTAAVSSDEGKTWRHIRDLETNADRTYSYISLIFVKDRAVLSYWEGQGRQYSSRFRSLPVSWFYAKLR